MPKILLYHENERIEGIFRKALPIAQHRVRESFLSSTRCKIIESRSATSQNVTEKHGKPNRN